MVLQVLNDRLSRSAAPQKAATAYALLYSQGMVAFEWRNENAYSLPKYCWSQLFGMGIDPADARRRYGYVASAPVVRKENPLNYASLYLLHGEGEAAQQLVDEYDLIKHVCDTPTDTTIFGLSYFPAYMGDNYFTYSPLLPIKPKEYGMEQFPLHKLDHVSHIAWLNEKGRQGLLERARTAHALLQLWYAQELLQDEPLRVQIQDTAEVLATRMLNSTGRLEYDSAASLIRVLRPEQARPFLQSNPFEGTRYALHICREDATTEEMLCGLRALTKMTGRPYTTMLSLFGRPPTAEEIAATRSKKIVDILREMPWSQLGPLVEDPNSLSTIRASLLPHFGNVDLSVFQNCLLEGDSRAEQNSLELIAESRPTWEEQFEPMWDHFRLARHYRASLLEVCEGDRYLGTLATLVSGAAGTTFMHQMGQLHPLWDAAYAYATANYPEPDAISLRLYGG